MPLSPKHKHSWPPCAASESFQDLVFHFDHFDPVSSSSTNLWIRFLIPLPITVKFISELPHSDGGASLGIEILPLNSRWRSVTRGHACQLLAAGLFASVVPLV